MEDEIRRESEEAERQLVLLQGMRPVAFSVLSVSLLNDLLTDSSDRPGRMIATLRPRFSDVPMTEELARRLHIASPDLLQPEDVETFFQVSYVENLTRMMLDEAIDTSGEVPSLHPALAAPAPDTEVMFVVNLSGKVIFGVRPHDVRRPHPTLVDESDPQVLNGGTITMRDGLIYEVRDDSGHFQPSSAGFESLLRAFSSLPSATFHPDFRGFQPFRGPPVVPDWAEPPPPVKARVAYGALRNDARLLITAIQNRIQADLGILGNARIPNKLRALNTALDRHGIVCDALIRLLEQVIAFVEAFQPTLGDVFERISLPGARRYAEETLRTARAFLVREGTATTEQEARDFVQQNHDVLNQILAALQALP